MSRPLAGSRLARSPSSAGVSLRPSAAQDTSLEICRRSCLKDSLHRDGSLPEQARSELPQRPLGIYIHVPFCTTRCGYCDFNTYTAAELGSEPGAARAGYIDAAIQELAIAARVLGPDAPAVSTIFVGGGTPTVLPPDDLGRLIAAVHNHFGLVPDAEVTTESNPESIDFADLQRLRELGFNRISFGMQSAVPQVLATLDRTHFTGPSDTGCDRCQGSRVRQHQP